MNITIKAAPVSINKKAVTAQILKQANGVWRDSIKAGILSILDDDKIAVDTGMAKSSLIPLARAGKFALEFASTIIPKSAPRPGITGLDGQWTFFGPRKGPQAGADAGEKGTKVKLGTKASPRWTLQYTIMVFHYRLHENGLAQLSSWRTLESFEKGFIAFIQQAIDNDSFIPLDLIKFGRIR